MMFNIFINLKKTEDITFLFCLLFCKIFYYLILQREL